MDKRTKQTQLKELVKAVDFLRYRLLRDCVELDYPDINDISICKTGENSINVTEQILTALYNIFPDCKKKFKNS